MSKSLLPMSGIGNYFKTGNLPYLAMWTAFISEKIYQL
jgi:hypothetical protein